MNSNHIGDQAANKAPLVGLGLQESQRLLEIAGSLIPLVYESENIRKTSKATKTPTIGTEARALEVARNSAELSLEAARLVSGMYARLVTRTSMTSKIREIIKVLGPEPAAMANEIRKMSSLEPLKPILARAGISNSLLERLATTLESLDITFKIDNEELVLGTPKSFDQKQIRLSLREFPQPISVVSLFRPDPITLLAATDIRALHNLRITLHSKTAKQPLPASNNVSIDEAVLLCTWGVAQGMHTKFREIEDRGVSFVEGAEGASAVGSIISTIITVLWIVGFLTFGGGSVIRILCDAGVITDGGVCTAGHVLMVIGGVLMGAGAVTGLATYGTTLTVSVDASGRSVPIFEVDIPPAVPSP